MKPPRVPLSSLSTLHTNIPAARGPLLHPRAPCAPCALCLLLLLLLLLLPFLLLAAARPPRARPALTLQVARHCRGV